MHNRHNLSPALPLATHFEHAWQPSRWQLAAHIFLAVLAALALLNCALPRPWAVPLAVSVLLMGLLQAWNQWRKPAQKILIPLPPACPCIDQQPLQSMMFIERGPLSILRWKANNAARGQLLFWPDTLPATQRRALRLAVRAHASHAISGK